MGDQLGMFMLFKNWIKIYQKNFVAISEVSSLSVIRQKGESQNGCFKKTKHAKFSEKSFTQSDNIFFLSSLQNSVLLLTSRFLS